MVQREFWKNVQKLDRYQKFQAQQEVHMKSQQKRLESFVNKQLKLSSKMADFLQETSGVDETEREEEGEELDQSDDDQPKSIKILIFSLKMIK